MPKMISVTPETVIAHTEEWLEKAVIGLNLCPFAKAVHVKKQIRYVVSQADTPQALLEELQTELELLAETSAEKIDTTLLIHPRMLNDFLDFNDFMEVAEGLLEELELDGTLQIANFHPQFQFEGSAADDIENFSNRSPYPILHLLREESIDRAVEAFPDAGMIYEKNIEELQILGHAGWNELNLSYEKPPKA
ncbi:MULTISPECIES: DUF1415 domain-containing protein [unclassified Undibacterium]|uniref:DUF1415 domain-containing protein n=1 Tax=unclassified Undibacterium TaxID=2630295 RepID=UPI002AC9DBBC|nr:MULTISPECIES: DUF1415 domain-containing protein [unclassified Undibacterium]MEB0140523.1 DUF1415 domain-containing protein [Undibacterium sp. CCC2.1]MEB0173500.1 DUF1415 domain-containing protein [Undibacterium sp. CCC1.1]MEB0177486.1 DUF1415 domain-containing protein [Undibacterium sp. CCC3.4]MEB0216648.1 DUF1415 domain-containing protein [Undibacterium sp. 5I2]WPX42365.1 DUF1415 domain-containing protein [Undibacterium sp. CCC3.4]